MCITDNKEQYNSAYNFVHLYLLKMLTAYYVLNIFLGFEVITNEGQSQPSGSLESKERKTASKIRW